MRRHAACSKSARTKVRAGRLRLGRPPVAGLGNPGALVTLACALLVVLTAPARADDPPVALAGQPFLAYPGEHIVLDGSASYDPEGWDLTFQWTQVGGPEVTLIHPDGPHPEFDAVEPGVHSFQLIVDDGFQASEPDVVDVIVVDPEIGARAGGCSSTPGAVPGLVAAGLLVPALVTRRRR
ncbi:MAG: hypothetical protein D6798_06485 [Deltaproteobacteria bacterium]|nr:MAG: hypothetical protein D6798_06485 [Deltaproteobacteria bacterium]